MVPALFHIDPDGSFNALTPAEYGSDAELQSLIAKHPHLLGGADAAGGDWIGLARNGPTPLVAELTPTWSVNHLFISSDGIPTVVETRRGADQRDNGDLCGQVLFYAANAEAWWPLDELRKAFPVIRARSGGDTQIPLTSFLGPDITPADFWSDVAANLAAGRVRMIVVVDHVQPDLARMVEFLGGQLRDAEVWILEAKQYAGVSGRLVQATVVGRSHRVAQTPALRPSAMDSSPFTGAPPSPLADGRRKPNHAPAPRAPRPPSPRDLWASSLRARCDVEEVAALNDILRWMGEQYGATFVTGPPSPALWLAVMEHGKERFPFGITEAKTAAIHLGALSASPAYESEESRRSLMKELEATGLTLESVDLKGDVRISLKSLASPPLRAKVLTVMDGVIETLRLKEAPDPFLV